MCTLAFLLTVAFGAAVGAKPDKRKVAEASLVSKLLAHLSANRVELFACDRPDGVAGLADEVLVLGGGERIQARTVAEVDVANQPDLLQGLEVAIDRGQIGARQTPFQALGDALGRKRTVGAVEGFEHEPTRGGCPQPALAQSFDRFLDAGGGEGRAAVSGRHLDLLQTRMRNCERVAKTI